jgi:hypothetical protein
MFYHYGFFNPKVTDKEEYYLRQYEKCSKMKYDERVDYEISRTRVNVTVKIDNFMMTNRLEKGLLPSTIESIVKEITKYKMLIESDYHNDKDIKDSIPPIDSTIVSVDLIKSLVSGKDEVDETEFDLDEILEKISTTGIESLTDKEKEFLDNKSKEM